MYVRYLIGKRRGSYQVLSTLVTPSSVDISCVPPTYRRYARVNREGGDFFPKLWTPEAAAELLAECVAKPQLLWRYLVWTVVYLYLGHDRGKLQYQKDIDKIKHHLQKGHLSAPITN